MKYAFAISLPLFAVFSLIILLMPGEQPLWATTLISAILGVVSGYLGAVIEHNKQP